MDLDDALEDLEAAPPLAELARDVVAARNTLIDRRANYVSLRPSPIGAIAAYVHANRISIAMEPFQAVDRAVSIPGASLQRTTPATTYVLVTSADVAAFPSLVQEWVVEALDWRAQGPAMTLADGRTAGTVKEPEVCPNCWLALPVTGVCDCT